MKQDDQGATSGSAEQREPESIMRQGGTMERKTVQLTGWVAAVLLLLVPALLQAQQRGVVEGQITDAATGDPVSASQIEFIGAQRGTLADGQGRYRIENVPVGTWDVQVQRLGYATETLSVTVEAESTVRLDVELRQAVVDLQEVVVTGVATATPRSQLAFTVERISAADLAVPHTNAIMALQSKMPGVSVVQGTGRPGTEPSVLLRGATAINASGRSQEPLYVIDGTVVGASLIDMDALDIESIEVVKGAAAASLYGARAGNGVIQITTHRGRGIADDQVQYSLRSEFGVSQQPNSWDIGPPNHQYAMTPDQQLFIDVVTGEPCEFRFCNGVRYAGQRAGPGDPATEWNTFMDIPFPQVFDNIGAVFPGGNVVQQHVQAQGRSGGTNFHVSYGYLHDEGIMRFQDGMTRHNFRFSLDQALRTDLTVRTTGFLSNSSRDMLGDDFNTDVFFRFARTPRGVDLMARDENGDFILPADPVHNNLNQLYKIQNRTWVEDRNRAMGNVALQYRPIGWLNLDGAVSYDHLETQMTDFRDRGLVSSRGQPWTGVGMYWEDDTRTTAFNASVDATVHGSLGDVSGRIRARWLAEYESFDWSRAGGYALGAKGIASLSNLEDQSRLSLSQNRTEVQSEGVFLSASGVYRDRYSVDALVRRDGSSLFGADERWQTYYRIAGAWLMQEEDWFNLDAVNEFKPRYSLGTAGGRPNFQAQYETYEVAAGAVTPVTLGNRDLQPEEIIEHELGLDMTLYDRFSVMLNYARSEARNQILPVPLPTHFGFTTQWQNTGTLESNTIEASLEALLLQRGDWVWTGRVNFDRTRTEITELSPDIPPFFTGPPGATSMFRIREGERLGTYYGPIQASRCDHLPVEVQPSCDSHFDVNDDGFLVYVGQGNSWRDMMWGTSGEVAGHSYQWGSPFSGLGTDPITGERTDFLPLGSTQPDFTLGWSSTLGWGGLSLYTLFDWVEGHHVWSQSRQWAIFVEYAGMMDQSGKPEDEKKPVGYYQELERPVSDLWVEDASFVKLREMSLSYRVPEQIRNRVPGLRATSGLNVSVTGRNLFTWTDYSSFDPDVGASGGATGSAALARIEGHRYPPFRTWTFAASLTF